MGATGPRLDGTAGIDRPKRRDGGTQFGTSGRRLTEARLGSQKDPGQDARVKEMSAAAVCVPQSHLGSPDAAGPTYQIDRVACGAVPPWPRPRGPWSRVPESWAWRWDCGPRHQWYSFCKMRRLLMACLQRRAVGAGRRLSDKRGVLDLASQTSGRVGSLSPQALCRSASDSDRCRLVGRRRQWSQRAYRGARSRDDWEVHWP